MKTKAENVISEYKNISKSKIHMSSDKESCASHIYGSMMIGLSMCNLFDLELDTNTLIKKMMLRNQGFRDIYDMYSIKFELMEYSLSKAFSVTSNVNEVYDIVKDKFKSYPKDRVLKLIEFYKYNYILINKERSGWNKEHWDILGKKETVSDHVYLTMNLAYLIYNNYSIDVDIDKLLKMILIHELGEAIIGDITPFDGVSNKLEIEHNAFKRVVSSLPNKSELFNLMCEFDSKSSNEAKLAYLCDKLECMLQAKMYFDEGSFRHLREYTDKVFLKDKVLKDIISKVDNPYLVWYSYNINLVDDKIYKDIILTSKYSNLSRTRK